LRGIDDVGGSLHAEDFSAAVDGLGNVAIDLHWRLHGLEAPPAHAWNVLSAHRTVGEVAGRDVRTLDRAGLALHLALHAAQHGPGDLKAIGDLERGLDRWPHGTWCQAARLAHQLRGTEAFAAGLALVPAGASLGRKLRLPHPDALLREIADRDSRPRGTFHLDAFTRAGSVGERLDVLRRSLLPPRAWIAWEYRWADGRRLRIAAAYSSSLRASGLSVSTDVCPPLRLLRTKPIETLDQFTGATATGESAWRSLGRTRRDPRTPGGRSDPVVTN
jgi:hypothetical protein